MENYIWDSRMEYLKSSREFIWNSDYFSFLVNQVWKIDKPVDIIDFGCGLGFMGSMFLPLLPTGSTYTGVDKGKKLLKEARKSFDALGLQATFIESDVYVFKARPVYDIAVCHTVLQHVPDAFLVMEKMRDSLKSGGMLLCIETDRNMTNAGLYFEGLDHNALNTLGLLQKLWYHDWKTGKSDSTVGTKLPAYMKNLGLNRIGVRINDRVDFLNPNENNDMYRRGVELFRESWLSLRRDKNAAVSLLIERGLTRAEAETMQAAEAQILDFLENRINDIFILTPLFLIIAFGYK